MAGLRTSLQGRASLGALVSLGHIPKQGGGGSPTIQLSNMSMPENSANGANVGALSVSNPKGTYTFTKTADPDGKFAVSGSNLNLAATLDYETKTTHSVTIQADNGVDAPITRTFSILVTNIVEGTLGPTTASFTEGATAGAPIATITGLDAGANETVVGVSPNDGRLAIASGNQLVVGLSASTAGTINATLTTSTGRTLSMAITVSSAYLIPAHTRWVALGDSITSQSSTKGLRNIWMITTLLLNGALRPAVGADQGKGGDTLTQMMARVGFTTGQKPGIVRLMGGHNDGMNTALATLTSRWQSIADAIWTANPATIIIAHACLPSTVETTQAQKDNLTAYNAYIASKANQSGNNRLVYIPVPAGWDPTAGVHTYDGTHPNDVGALLAANNEAAILNPLIQPVDVLSELTANAWHGANLDGEHALPGTNGAFAGSPLPTGALAAGKRLTNTAGLATVTASKGTIGSDATQIIDMSGTPAAENNVTFDENTGSNVSIVGTPGQFFEYLIGIDIKGAGGSGAPTGVRNLLASLGSLGNHGNAQTDAANTAQIDGPLSGVLRTWPAVLQSTASSISPAVSVRLAAIASALQVRLYRPIVRQTELEAYSAPFYVGNDGIKGSSETLRITGTGVVGNTLTGNPGAWSGGAISFSPQWYKNGVPISGATAYTYVIQAGDSGATITFRPNPSNTMGSDSTTESAGIAVS